jgi:iron(III) transport system permease protein
MEAARLLGAGLGRRIGQVALPLARPALAAGVSLALMETLADYGVGAYFGLQTFTTGIYKAWLAMDDRLAAAQLATMLMLVVASLLWVERRAQARLRFDAGRTAAPTTDGRQVALHGPRAVLAFALCLVPVLLGFVLPVAVLVRSVWLEARQGDFGLPWSRFAGWAWTSLTLASMAAFAAVALAVLLGFVLRQREAGVARPFARLVSLGYAVPGGVIAVGLLLPVAWVQAAAPGSALANLVTLAVTGSVTGLIYAYLVRFCAVALQSVEAGYARIPLSMDDSARMLGAGPGRLFFGVHAALLRRSATVAGLLVFVDVMKELPATLVLRPFNSDTLAVVAYQFARDERLAEAALPSIAIVLVGLIPVVLLSRAMRSSSR